MKTREFTGKTTQEAIDQGLNELGVTIADVRVEVIQEGAKGLFGLFGSKPAKVRISVFEEEKEEDEGLSDLLGSFSLDADAKKGKQKQQVKQPEQKKQEKKSEKPVATPIKEVKAPEKPKISEPEPVVAEPVQEKADKVVTEVPKPRTKPEEPRKSKPAAEKKSSKKKPMPETQTTEPENIPEVEEESETTPPFAPTEPALLLSEETPAGRAQHFLIELAKHMGVQVEVYVDDSQPGSINIHMIGDTLGILIGRRGETLDALQYLTSLQVNKGQDEYIRVTVDSENYRAKREDSLRRLALRMANRAQKTGRRVVLEPMNPYERRILHTTLQNHPAVTTHSEGEEPNRHVVVMLKNPQGNHSAEGKEKGTQEGRGSSRRKNRRRYSKKGHTQNNEPELAVNESVTEIVEDDTEA